MATSNSDKDEDNKKCLEEVADLSIRTESDATMGKEDAATNSPVQQIEDDSDTSSWDSGPLVTSLKRYHPLPHGGTIESGQLMSSLKLYHYHPHGGTIEDDQIQHTIKGTDIMKPVGIQSLRDQVSFNESIDLDDGGRQAADSDYEACESSDETIDTAKDDIHASETYKESGLDDDKLSKDVIEDVLDFDDLNSKKHLALVDVTDDAPSNCVLEGNGKSKDRFEFLLEVLQEQHRQQVTLQREQQEKQLAFLSMQINELVMPSDTPALPSHETFSSSNPKVVVQHSPNRVKNEECTASTNKTAITESAGQVMMSVTTESLASVQQHFLEQQQKIQMEYDRYLEDLQKQWMTLHEQQTQQQLLLNSAMTDKMQRMKQTGGCQRVMETHQTPVKEDDDNSTVYSNFSYWQYDDTYRPLPKTHTRQDYTGFLDDSDLQILPGISACADSQLTERLDLKEKHSRHIADLKDFYENEICELKQQLHDSLSQAPQSVWQEANLKQQLHNSLSQTPQSVWQEANERLQQKCQQLEAALKLSSNRIEDLEATVKTLDTRLVDWPKKYEVAIDTITILEKQAESFNILCVKKNSELSDCKRTIEELRLYLHQSYEDQLNNSEDADYDVKPKIIDLKRGHDQTETSSQAKPHVPSVEERKFLTSGADFNLFNGEVNHSSDTEKDSENMLLENESGIYRLADSDLDVSLNYSGLFASTRNTLHPPPFDSDLDERPISPMMKAAAQFKRWKHYEEFEKCQSQSPLSDQKCQSQSLCSDQKCQSQSPLSDQKCQSQSLRSDQKCQSQSPLSDQKCQSQSLRSDQKCQSQSLSSDQKYQSQSLLSDQKCQSQSVLSDKFANANDSTVEDNVYVRSASLCNIDADTERFLHDELVEEHPLNSEQSAPTQGSGLQRDQLQHLHSERKSKLSENSRNTSNKKIARRSEHTKTPRRLFYQDSTTHVKTTHSSRSKEKCSRSSLTSNLTSPYSPPRTRRSISLKNSPYRPKSSSPKANCSSMRKSLFASTTEISPPRHTFNPKSDISPKFKGILDRDHQTTTRFNVCLDETPTKDVGPRKKWNTNANSILKTLDILNSDGMIGNTEWKEPNTLSTNGKRQHSNNDNVSMNVRSSIEEKIHSLSAVEKRYDYLTKEKKEIESALSRLPSTSRMSRQTRQNEEQLELRYDDVVRELGSVRMLLRKYNILKTST